VYCFLLNLTLAKRYVIRRWTAAVIQHCQLSFDVPDMDLLYLTDFLAMQIHCFLRLNFACVQGNSPGGLFFRFQYFVR
jgi:hypothetical protein